jgi:hypothetical protein
MFLTTKKLIVYNEVATKKDVNDTNIERWNSNAPIEPDGAEAALFQTIVGLTKKMGWSKKEAM